MKNIFIATTFIIAFTTHAWAFNPMPNASPQVEANGSITFNAEAVTYWRAAQRIWAYSTRTRYPENAICGMLSDEVDDAMWDIIDDVDQMARSYGSGSDIHSVINIDRGRVAENADIMINERNTEFCAQLRMDTDVLGLPQDWIVFD